ncbi:MAG: protein translocase subunit SecF [Treponema sp.]|jgi:preprotein translocase subunit SecF|nr:protein translocase subunit SecF [Treponema sp.]
MKKIIRFSKLFLPAAIFSSMLAITGITGYIVKGFNLGVDFQAGLIQEVQFAPTAFNLTWSGAGNASIFFDRGGLYIVLSGAGIEARTVTFSFSEYRTVGALCDALGSQVEGIDVSLNASGSISSTWLIYSAQGHPQLGSNPYVVHYLDPQSSEIRIETVREALAGIGQSVAVQSLGQPKDRHFMLRVEDKQDEGGESVPSERVISALEGYFGTGEVVVLRSDYVGSRFSKNLTDQAGILIGLTLLVMLIYVTIRFKPQYGIGLVLGIIHDGLVIVGFVVWSGMEFNTTTIAAILTIVGYSTNNTIVVFDRVRESLRIFPDESFVNVLNISLTATLGRTIITTLSTMLAVLSLFIFTTGSMKDFALCLMIGMTSGVYTTMFIASGFVNLWEREKVKREKRKLIVPVSPPVKA